MGYLALYRKYRPTSFDDMVGQDKVVRVIQNAIDNGRISHAYLFFGPRGTGKTTSAKIIAKMVNCVKLVDGRPCGECDSCRNILNSSDVVEIDAASNNGVDEIRELRDKVNLVPTSCKYKIYIIDEVHMLTVAAFNALLKTLEEPPSHVIFILATTEYHKIPLTILSRCQKFQFSKLDNSDLVKRLNYIADVENIDIDEEALYEIARLSDGGCRDAVNFLDQLSSYKKGHISISDVYEVNGSVSYGDLFLFLEAISCGNNGYVINFVESINSQGKNISKFIEEAMTFLKDVIVFRNAKLDILSGEKLNNIKKVVDLYNDNMVYSLIEELNDLLNRIKTSSYPSILFIVSMMKFISSYSNVNVNKNHVKVSDEKISLKALANNVGVGSENFVVNDSKLVNSSVASLENKKYVMSNDVKRIRVNNALALASKLELNAFKSKWNDIFSYLDDVKYGVLVGMLNDVEPVVVGKNYVVFDGKYDSLCERVNEHSLEIADFLKNIFKVEYRIIALSTNVWESEKKKYISNLKLGKKYVVIEENDCSNVNISSNVEKNAVDELLEVVGNDIIEYV